MRTARDIAAYRDDEILVLSVVALPEQTPLSEGRSYVDDRCAILDDAMAVEVGGGDAEIPVDGIVRIGHHVDETIVHTVAQHDSDAILMGWRSGPSRRRDVVVGSTIDEVVPHADCDVLVERIGGAERPEPVLPTAGGPHADYAAEVARAIAHTTGATITVQCVVDPDLDGPQLEEATETLETTARILDDVPHETQLDEGEDVADAIVAASADHDMTIIGATREGLLQRLVFGVIPETVGREADGTVIMAKKNLGITSRIRRFFSQG